MKVLFVYPNIHNTSRINLGIAYLSARLKQEGHQVKLFDTTFYRAEGELSDDQLREKSLQVKNIDLTKHGLKYRSDKFLFDDFRTFVQNYKPDILALSCVDATYYLGRRLMESVQDLNKFTIVGGVRATVDPSSIIDEKWVKALCVGEGEDAMVELCEGLENGGDISTVRNLWVKSNGGLTKNAIRPLIDLNDLPEPDWGIFDDMHFIRPFAGKVYRLGSFDMSRSCPYRCNYCVNQFYAKMYKGKGKYFRQKTPEKITAEIKEKRNEYDLNFISFYDDLFPTSDYTDRFCELYSREIGLPFTVNMRPETVNRSVIGKLVDVGLCSVAIGIESGDYEFRKRTLSRNYTNQQVIEAFKIIRESKIRSSSFNMIGLPFETRGNIFKTIELNRLAKPSSATVSYFYPYRGTPLRDVCVDEGFFDPEKEDTMDIAHRTNSSLSMPQISKDELERLFVSFQLYSKLPKIFWPVIRFTENGDQSNKIVYRLLVALFNFYSKKDFEWDFTTVAVDRNGTGK